MAGLPEPLRIVLAPAVEAIRARLRDLDPPEVPPPLRKVVAYTGRRLPPPLEKSLLVELDRNEWLRDKLAESTDDDSDPVLAEFLSRPPGWWIATVEGVAAAAAAAPVADVSGELAATKAKLAEAKRRLGEQRSENAALSKQVRGLRKELRARSTAADSPQRAAGLAKQVEDLSTALATEQSRRAASEARVEQLRRRKRQPAKAPQAAGDERVVGLRDPVAAARRLDIQAAAFAAAARAESAPQEAHDDFVDMMMADEPAPLALPAGIAPDSVEAIRWLLAGAQPVPVIVDGYNVTFLLEPDTFGASEARKRLIAELERLVRRARSAHRVMVVFDSALEGGSQPGQTAGGVEVRFATNAATADDEIVDLARTMDGRAIVVTNDRELRERVGAVGALTLWGSALASWIAE